MVVPGLIFISVEQHDGYFRAGHQKSKAEEKQQFQYDPRQALRPAHLGKKSPERFCVHADHILFHRIADLCGKRNRRNVYPRF